MRIFTSQNTHNTNVDRKQHYKSTQQDRMHFFFLHICMYQKTILIVCSPVPVVQEVLRARRHHPSAVSSVVDPIALQPTNSEVAVRSDIKPQKYYTSRRPRNRPYPTNSAEVGGRLPTYLHMPVEKRYATTTTTTTKHRLAQQPPRTVQSICRPSRHEGIKASRHEGRDRYTSEN